MGRTPGTLTPKYGNIGFDRCPCITVILISVMYNHVTNQGFKGTTNHKCHNPPRSLFKKPVDFLSVDPLKWPGGVGSQNHHHGPRCLMSFAEILRWIPNMFMKIPTAGWQPCWIKWNPVLGRAKPPCLPLESYFAVASPSRILPGSSIFTHENVVKSHEIPIFLWLPIHVDSPQIMDGSKILIFCQTKRAGDELTREMRTGEQWSLHKPTGSGKTLRGATCYPRASIYNVENPWGNPRKMLDVFFFPTSMLVYPRYL